MSKDPSAQLIAEAKAMKYSRRTVMKRASALGLSGAALGGVLSATGHAVSAAPNRAPAFLQGGSLNMLMSTAFVPAAQDLFAEQAQTWGEENGVDVTVDFINWPDLQPRTTSAVQAGDGPDIIEMWDTIPYLFSENLVDMTEIAAQAEEVQGGYYDWVTNTASVDGQWLSVPHGNSASVVAYRASYFEEAGVQDAANNFPETWEELFEVGKALKEMGKPLGQALGQSLGDPPGFAYPYMWAFGAMEVEEDGETVAFDTEMFREGLEMFIQGWADGFDETGLGWDDSTNNSAYLSDQISATQNGTSIYIAATDEEGDNYNPELAEDTYHAPLPAGPAGRFATLGSRSIGVMQYSDNQEEAMAFLEWWFSAEPFQAWLEAYEGYILPPGPTFTDLGVYTEDPKLAPYIEVPDMARNKGWAGPANLKAAQVSSQYIIVNTFANAVQSGDAGAAIEEAAALLERIYSR